MRIIFAVIAAGVLLGGHLRNWVLIHRKKSNAARKPHGSSNPWKGLRFSKRIALSAMAPMPEGAVPWPWHSRVSPPI